VSTRSAANRLGMAFRPSMLSESDTDTRIQCTAQRQ
jgi:hypothetical protein